jgi:hypothetical protein
MDVKEIGCENGRSIEVGQDLVLWWALLSAVSKLLVPLPQSWIGSDIAQTI